MLRIRHPATRLPERRYIFDVILREFLGLDYRLEPHGLANVTISWDSEEAGNELVLADVLFQVEAEDWLNPASMPARPLRQVDLDTIDLDLADLPSILPVIYGTAPRIVIDTHGITVDVDVFGSSFFMLTRYEELVTPTRDRHARFPATASLAWQEQFLDRPIVNEYVELLWACIHRLFPQLKRAPRKSRVLLSHDVDWPAVNQGKRLPHVVRAASADILRRKDPVLAVRRLGSWPSVRRGKLDHDVGNVFDTLMSRNENHHLTSTFFFLAAEGRGDVDGAYTVEHPWIGSLMRRIHDRGHQIGIHPAYRTFRDPVQTRIEFQRLQRACQDVGIVQPAWGGRQHYLRWENPTTWQNYEDAGLAYDTTLGFADHVGFRTGVCYEYPVFNLLSRQVLQLRERPLIVMDATLFGDRRKSSMALGPREGVNTIAHLKATCDRYHGDFTLLWHNTWLLQGRHKCAYRNALELIAVPAA